MNPIITPLSPKEIEMTEWFKHNNPKAWEKRIRLMFFDPSEVYARIIHLIDTSKRIQATNITTEMLFPKRDDGLCRCGCGKTAKYSWASDMCSSFTYSVRYIIIYGTPEARKPIETYYGKNCSECNAPGHHDIDHIVPVKHGGGGCWLSNFIPLCQKCHKQKTKRDFNWGEYKIESNNTLKLDL